MTAPADLPILRRERKLVSLAKIAGLVHKGIASINATIEPRARYWDRHNAEAVRQDGPLWVALGDSVTQGIGSSAPDRSYVPLVLDRLRRETGHAWRVVNLSMSGARFDDVIDKQLPAMASARLEPVVVSAIIGSNDIVWRRDTDGIIGDARRLVADIPGGTLLSRVSEAKDERKRSGVNEVFDAAAERGRVHLFGAWDWPTGDGMWAEDRFHPNDRAYECIAQNLWQGLTTHRLI